MHSLAQLVVLFFAASAIFCTLHGIKAGVELILSLIVKDGLHFEHSFRVALCTIVVGSSTLGFIHFGGWA